MLIFIPEETSCEFKNFEYNTVLTFDKYGRYSNHPIERGPGIAVLGDSHAMGWGVNDSETFSAILEGKIDKPVYNLAVSGYGTIRKLIRFEKFELANSVDTVIIQYTYNDWGENNSYKKNTPKEAKEKFNIVKDIPSDTAQPIGTGGPDFLLRGGYLVPGRSIDDVSRLTKMFFDLTFFPNSSCTIAANSSLSFIKIL